MEGSIDAIPTITRTLSLSLSLSRRSSDLPEWVGEKVFNCPMDNRLQESN